MAMVTTSSNVIMSRYVIIHVSPAASSTGGMPLAIAAAWMRVTGLTCAVSN